MEWKIKIVLYIGVCLLNLMMFVWGYLCKKKNISQNKLLGMIVGIISAMISIGFVFRYL